MESSRLPQLSSMVSRADRVVDSDVDEEQALLSMDTGRYYGMSEIGRYIWELLARPWVVNELVSMLGIGEAYQQWSMSFQSVVIPIVGDIISLANSFLPQDKKIPN